MSVARGAAMALLGTLLMFIAGCHPARPSGALSTSERARMYAAVLRDVRPDAAVEWVVVDSLLPATDIDADQHQMVLGGLSITPPVLDRFLRAQRAPREHFQIMMLPDSGWRVVSMSRLDSLRAAARADAMRGTPAQGVLRDGFWQQWYRAYPSSGGYVVLSPASVSDDGSSAVVKVRVACGSVCGSSELRLMRRDPTGRWWTSGRVRLSES